MEMDFMEMTHATRVMTFVHAIPKRENSKKNATNRNWRTQILCRLRRSNVNGHD